MAKPYISINVHDVAPTDTRGMCYGSYSVVRLGPATFFAPTTTQLVAMLLDGLDKLEAAQSAHDTELAEADQDQADG